MPGFAGDQPASRWSRWTVAWHVLFFGMLIGVTATLLVSDRTVAPPGLSIAVVALLAAWYAAWMVARPDLVTRSTALRVTYFSVAAVLWFGLMVVDRNYTNLWIVAAVQLFGFLGLRTTLAGMLVVLLMVLTSHGLHGDQATEAVLRWRGVGWGDVGGTILGLGLTTLCLHFFRELTSARSELAAAERQAGILVERQRIAGDIHDTVTQGLASIVMLLEAAEASWQEGHPDAGQRIQEAARTAREGLRDVRRLVWDLRPEALAQGTLGEALGRLAAQLEDETGVAARTVITGEVGDTAPQIEGALLRVAQEALANVRRHADAHEVTVTLSYLDDVVALDVQDDGRGFDPPMLAAPNPGGGLGLTAMRERVEALGGTLIVESAPREGVTVAVQLPTRPMPEARSPISAGNGRGR
jgi:signal transduction histidine kinase